MEVPLYWSSQKVPTGVSRLQVYGVSIQGAWSRGSSDLPPHPPPPFPKISVILPHHSD